NQPWREPIHPSSPLPKHYRQKNPIRKNKTRRKIDGFVSGLNPLETAGFFIFMASCRFNRCCKNIVKLACHSILFISRSETGL
ncbi:hypothetical protein, partial [Rhizobium ruizarguesonis]